MKKNIKQMNTVAHVTVSEKRELQQIKGGFIGIIDNIGG